MSAAPQHFPELAQQPPRRLRNTSFVNCGVAGFAVAAVLSHLLILRVGLSPWIQFVCGVTAAVGLLGTALAVKVFTGEDGFVFYRDAITALVLVGIVLHLLHQPVLPYLDVTILGAGLFQAFGRIGCLLVGCCHGRPARFGVRYETKHAQNGFPRCLVGTRLLPIQAIESIYVVSLVFLGCRLLLSSPPRGSVTAFYILAYAFGRFWLELFRGDVERPFFGGFSQAQWISLVLAALAACSERLGILPQSQWHWAVPLSIGSAMSLLYVHRRCDPSDRFELTHPRHIRELAEAMQGLDISFSPDRKATNSESSTQSVQLLQTSAGLRLSSGKLSLFGRRMVYFSVSRHPRQLELRQVRRLAILISRLNSFTVPFDLKPSASGVFHILFSFPTLEPDPSQARKMLDNNVPAC